MTGPFMGEFVAARWEAEGPGAAERVVWDEPLVRCRDCRFCKDVPRGAVCTLRGEAGWFETGEDDFCSKGERP